MYGFCCLFLDGLACACLKPFPIRCVSELASFPTQYVLPRPFQQNRVVQVAAVDFRGPHVRVCGVSVCGGRCLAKLQLDEERFQFISLHFILDENVLFCCLLLCRL